MRVASPAIPCAAVGKAPDSTFSRQVVRAAMASSRRLAARPAWRGAVAPSRPSRSGSTCTCPVQPAPAPMPIVGMVRRLVIAAASSCGTSSITIADAPASCRAIASSRSAAAASGRRPFARGLLSFSDDCGVKPICPITGTPLRTSAATTGATVTPPSSFTAPAPASRINRAAFSAAVGASTYERKGMSPITSALLVERTTAAV